MQDDVVALVQEVDGGWTRFEQPVLVLETRQAGEVAALLSRAETLARRKGWHAVGFVTYEAGGAFGLPVRPEAGVLPLAWFALYEPAHVTRGQALPSSGAYRIRDLTPSLGHEAFRTAFARVRGHLADGDTYQVNYTFRMDAAFEGSPEKLFADLVTAQQGGHGAFIAVGRYAICSASPELFFAREGQTLVARPMKGTARRGRTTAEDERQRDALRASPKERAENVMIVDMMRNDLGRIAEIGSVTVPSLFDVERYPTVWQMTSRVEARATATLAGIFGALFPSASVTGAPKVSTMAILRNLETRPRGLYTGAIGHMAPDGTAHFNVAIRTAIVDREAGSVEFGIGSGLVWDSDAAQEYAECLLKADVLGRVTPPFDLLETLLWTPQGGCLLLERHLDRLRDSASYFGYPVDEGAVRDAVAARVAGADGPRRVRVLCSRSGDVRVEIHTVKASPLPLRVRLATAPVDSSDVFLFHKTTNRSVYEGARVPDCDDTILWNQDGEVTEATMANVVLDLDGTVVTPPIECGLLAGTCRADLLASGAVRERRVRVADLGRARRIWLTNGVHGRRPARLVTD